MVQDTSESNLPYIDSFHEWPTNSPDLNSTDYTVWLVLEAITCRKPHRPVDALKVARQKAWDELDAVYLGAAVNAFSKRLKSYVDADGDIFQT